MIDIHSHCLPFIDDGADSIETSLSMLETAKMCGAHTVVATPHFVLGKQSIDVFCEKRKASYDQIAKEISLQPEKYPTLLTGAEVLLTGELPDSDDLHKLCYEGTNYMLIELSGVYSVSSMAEWIYNISIKGIEPVIAHVDRYHFCKEIIGELSDMDVVYQVNAGFFLRLFAAGDIKNLLKLHDKFVVASDMHNLGQRAFNLHKAYEKSMKIVPSLTEDMFETLPCNIILGNKNLKNSVK